jgi:hypothetical protein
MTNECTELARQAWKEAMGDAQTAVWLLRNSTNLSLREAFELIQKTAAEVGGRCNLRIINAAELLAVAHKEERRDRDE